MAKRKAKRSIVANHVINDPELIALAAAGKAKLPDKKLPASFWKMPTPNVPLKIALAALRADRDEE